LTENLLNFPKVIPIDTVSCCNLKCSMCFHKNMKRKKGFMPWELFTKIIDEIAVEDKNARIWMVFFGEPFVRAKKKPTIFDMIKYTKDKGLTDVVINTNACLMDEENARKTIESGLDQIYIGIDAASSETYSKCRVGGDFKTVVKNVLKLIELKNELKSQTPKIFVQLIEMKENSSEKQEFIDFWTNAGATVKIRPKISWAGKVESYNQVVSDRYECKWALTTIAITDTGDVVCAEDLDGEHSFGNVYKKSIKEIWNTSVKEFRENHLKHQWDDLHDLCRNCTDWQGYKRELIEPHISS